MYENCWLPVITTISPSQCPHSMIINLGDNNQIPLIIALRFPLDDKYILFPNFIEWNLATNSTTCKLINSLRHVIPVPLLAVSHYLQLGSMLLLQLPNYITSSMVHWLWAFPYFDTMNFYREEPYSIMVILRIHDSHWPIKVLLWVSWYVLVNMSSYIITTHP